MSKTLYPHCLYWLVSGKDLRVILQSNYNNWGPYLRLIVMLNSFLVKTRTENRCVTLEGSSCYILIAFRVFHACIFQNVSCILHWLTILRYGYNEDMQMEKDTLLKNIVRYITRIDRHLDLYSSGSSNIWVPFILCVLQTDYMYT